MLRRCFEQGVNLQQVFMGQQILFMFVQPLLKDYRIVLSTLFLSIICSSISYISLILATHYPVNKTLLCTHSSWPMNRTSSIIVATLFASANPCLLFRIFAFHPKLKRESAFLLFILLPFNCRNHREEEKRATCAFSIWNAI